MLFTLTDVILIIAVAFFAFLGFALGLVGLISWLVSMVLGFWLAYVFYEPIAQWLTPVFLGHVVAAEIMAFSVIFFVVNRLLTILMWLIKKAFWVIKIIPFAKSIDKFAGLFLGLIEGVLLGGLFVFVVANFLVGFDWLYLALNQSKVAHFLVYITELISYLLI